MHSLQANLRFRHEHNDSGQCIYICVLRQMILGYATSIVTLMVGAVQLHWLPQDVRLHCSNESSCVGVESNLEMVLEVRTFRSGVSESFCACTQQSNEELRLRSRLLASQLDEGLQGVPQMIAHSSFLHCSKIATR